MVSCIDNLKRLRLHSAQNPLTQVNKKNIVCIHFDMTPIELQLLILVDLQLLKYTRTLHTIDMCTYINAFLNN